MNDASSNHGGISTTTLALIAHVVGIVPPPAGLLGAFLVWMATRDKPEQAFAAVQAKEQLNFGITVLAAAVLCCITIIGIILAPLVLIAGTVLSIIAAVKASKGEAYRFPFTIRLIK